MQPYHVVVTCAQCGEVAEYDFKDGSQKEAIRNGITHMQLFHECPDGKKSRFSATAQEDE